VVTWCRAGQSAQGLVLIRSLPYTLACTAKSASGTAGGFIGLQPVTYLDRHASPAAPAGRVMSMTVDVDVDVIVAVTASLSVSVPVVVSVSVA
jgi:hypothetical protein